MRLLNVTTKQVEQFLVEGKIPEYAILSHTWGKPADEVTLQDLSDPNVVKKGGYKKIEYCFKQAKVDGLGYVWVDTCCIDKTNQVELSEAINSMFQWYRGAKICYAYLADAEDDALKSNSPNSSSFVESRWFTRGWTLQELIAPSSVVFFSKNWSFLGTKESLAKSGSLLSTATKIDNQFLLKKDLILHDGEDSPSIAQIMSWASERETTKTEDMAYCLLGIFGVKMPINYGEGMNAFTRLQEGLLKIPYDQTLFGWGPELEYPLSKANLDADVEWVTPMVIPLLAPTPDEFRNSGNILRKSLPHAPTSTSPTSIVDGAVRIELPVLTLAKDGPELAVNAVTAKKLVFAVTACSFANKEGFYLGIPLCPLLKPDGTATGIFRRTGTVLVPQEQLLDTEKGARSSAVLQIRAK